MRLITVPKTKDAMERFEFDNAKAEELIEVKLPDEQFERLWSTGIFAELSEKLVKLIDDYEYEEIKTLSELRHAQAIIDYQVSQQEDVEDLRVLLEVFEKAIEYRTGVFFYF